VSRLDRAHRWFHQLGVAAANERPGLARLFSQQARVDVERRQLEPATNPMGLLIRGDPAELDEGLGFSEVRLRDGMIPRQTK
jgi:hypothetical protein